MFFDIKCGSFSVSEVNEDFFGFEDDCAWVLDGSTGLNRRRLVAPVGSTDAQWYADSFSKYLSGHLNETALSLPEIFSRGVKHVWGMFVKRATFSIGQADVPCCLGTAVRRVGSQLEYICIGDCVLLIGFRDGTAKELFDPALRALDNNVIEHGMIIAKEKGISFSECIPQLYPELRQNRALANKPDGYYALSNDWESIKKAKTGIIPLDCIQDICLLSDGFAQYYQLFKLVSGPGPFLRAIRNKETEKLYEELLSAQKADESMDQHPRLKLSDDATISYFRLK